MIRDPAIPDASPDRTARPRHPVAHLSVRLAGALLVTSAVLLGPTPGEASSLGFLDLSTGSSGFANTPIAGPFTDTANFSLATSTVINASVIATALGTRDVDFTSIVISGTSGSYAFAPLSGNAFELQALPSTILAAGNYTVTFNGTNGTGRGSYGGNLAVTPLVGAPPLSAGTHAARPLDLSIGSTGFFNTPVAGSFVDTFTFTLANGLFLASSLTSALNGSQDIDFTSIDIQGEGGTFAFSELFGDPVEAYAVAATFLTAGQYTLTVRGANSAAGASYGGSLAVNSNSGANGVPEPGTLALLLGTLGPLTIASRARRRRHGAPMTGECANA